MYDEYSSVTIHTDPPESSVSRSTNTRIGRITHPVSAILSELHKHKHTNVLVRAYHTTTVYAFRASDSALPHRHPKTMPCLRAWKQQVPGICLDARIDHRVSYHARYSSMIPITRLSLSRKHHTRGTPLTRPRAYATPTKQDPPCPRGAVFAYLSRVQPLTAMLLLPGLRLRSRWKKLKGMIPPQ